MSHSEMNKIHYQTTQIQTLLILMEEGAVPRC